MYNLSVSFHFLYGIQFLGLSYSVCFPCVFKLDVGGVDMFSSAVFFNCFCWMWVQWISSDGEYMMIKMPSLQ